MGSFEFVFEALGISPEEERVYLALLDHPSESVTALSNASGLPRGRVQQALLALRDRGLVTEPVGKPRRYLATSPEASLASLISRRQQQLESARIAAAELGDRYRRGSSRAETTEAVEVVTGPEAIAQQFDQLKQGLRSELMIVDRPPYTTSVADELSTEVPLLGRGVRCRTIYAADALDIPGRLETITQLAAAGEEVRFLAEVPTKLAIGDRRVALMPLNLQQPAVEDGLVVRESFLLDALILFFEQLWESAAPLLSPEGSAGKPPRGTEQMLPLLASGLNDKSIARALGVSRSTLERRIRSMMSSLRAHNRFQAGVEASRRGWIA